MQKKEVYIIAAARTPIGSFGGSLKSMSATQLGAVAIQGVVEKAQLPSSDIIDEVIMGNVLQANVGQAPARQAAQFAGLPDTVIATTVNKVCASGLKAVTMAAQSILLDDAQTVIAGGMESMSNTPHYATTLRWGTKYGDSSLVDGIAKDGLTDVYKGYAMGVAADLCAEKYHFSREIQDDFAINSYRKSQYAIENGYFNEEIVPVKIASKGQVTLVKQDEEPYQVKFEKIPSLRPAFSKEGTVTAANASTINDGAAALLLMSQDKVKDLQLQPIARIVSYADAEQTPESFTTTPTLALQKALQKASLSIDSIDYFEFNEAFSVVGLVNTQLLDIPIEKVNVHGGAVALGHPLGCSGARILVSLLHILAQHNGRYGAAAICNGGGGATAIIVEYLR
jgi:acetyl-CoA C-acetyltransferase